MSDKLYYDFDSKLNKDPLIAYCTKCLERSLFRATKLEQENFYEQRLRMTCTRCLASHEYGKKRITRSDFFGTAVYADLTFSQKVDRFFIRLKAWRVGRWNRPKHDTRLLRGK